MTARQESILVTSILVKAHAISGAYGMEVLVGFFLMQDSPVANLFLVSEPVSVNSKRISSRSASQSHGGASRNESSILAFFAFLGPICDGGHR